MKIVNNPVRPFTVPLRVTRQGDSEAIRRPCQYSIQLHFLLNFKASESSASDSDGVAMRVTLRGRIMLNDDSLALRDASILKNRTGSRAGIWRGLARNEGPRGYGMLHIKSLIKCHASKRRLLIVTFIMLNNLLRCFGASPSLHCGAQAFARARQPHYHRSGTVRLIGCLKH